MKKIFQYLMPVLLLAAAPVQAANYVCTIAIGTVFSDQKLNEGCVETLTDSSVVEVIENGVVTQRLERVDLKKVMDETMPPVAPAKAKTLSEDVRIVETAEPTAEPAAEPTAKPAAEPEKKHPSAPAAKAASSAMKVKLRNSGYVETAVQGKGKKAAQAKAAELNRKAKIIVAPTVAAEKPKPQLSRSQILQKELRSEQSALARAEAKLNAARKKGDAAAAGRLAREVSDRQAGIRAMQSEMKR